MKRPEHDKETNPIVPLLYRAQPDPDPKRDETQGKREEEKNAGNEDWNRLENMEFESTNEQYEIAQETQPRTEKKPL